jgi:hypothetical protein
MLSINAGSYLLIQVRTIFHILGSPFLAIRTFIQADGRGSLFFTSGVAVNKVSKCSQLPSARFTLLRITAIAGLIGATLISSGCAIAPPGIHVFPPRILLSPPVIYLPVAPPAIYVAPSYHRGHHHRHHQHRNHY